MTSIAEQVSSPASVSVATKFASMSTSDLAEAIELLASLRYTAHTAACLANHMGKLEIEDFADDLVAGLNDRLEELDAQVRRRVIEITMADVVMEDAAARIGAIIYPDGDTPRYDAVKAA